ncbi:uncharacterized protein LOC125679536 isoform X3 [Ostrea edulis]|uniref:uncharacterized protein LOC125679536 isoform X3 n=1 Tax=Ostrea edulis TaxID=37623 RepID=UPI0024AF3FD9|nr:uncharacterized protein LOC125679536 isoform X3 [Ostrea edulis]
MTEHEKRTRVDDLSPKRSKVQESSAKSDQAVDTNLELDPDLMLEVDISLDNTDRTQSTQSRRISARTKSVPRRGMFAGSDRNGQTGRSPVHIKTRARPIKPHETEPFLSIDNLSPDKLQQLMAEKEANSPSKNESRKDRRSKTPVISTNQNYPFWATAKSPYSSPIPPRSSSRGGARTPSSMIFLSPNPTSKANQHIKSPFKHAMPKKKDFDDSSTFSERSSIQTPAAEMKERTAVATYCVGRVLSKEREKPEQRRAQGKLLKGKSVYPIGEYIWLKPLKPVNVEGPSINNCRGILSDHITENRSPATPANRTLARRRELIQRIPNVHEYLYDRPRTVESIHRTSAASSIDENREFKDDEGSPPDTSRMSPIESDINMPAAPPASMATTYKVVDGMPQPTPTPRNLTELQSTSTRENFLKKGDSGSVFNENSFRQLEPDNTLMTMFEETERPETPGDKTKNVRFSDGVNPEKTVKESTEGGTPNEKVMNVEVTIKGQDKKDKKEKGKSTCKMSDSNNGKKKDGDEGPDGQGGGGPKGNNSNERETSSRNSEGKSQAKNEENKENYGKQNSGSPASEKCNKEQLKIETTQLLPSEQAKKFSANTHYTLISSSHEISTPSVLNIQSVIHGGSIHQLVGPESPHRSRSPSPSRSPTRSPSRSQNRSPTRSQTPSSAKYKSDKTNKLIRPSSANQQTRKSRRMSKESQSSTNTLTARKSKVHFEGEKPPRQSVFVETAECDRICVGLKEERALTFEEIEAELNFIKEDIEERRKFEDMDRISIDSDDQSVMEEENMDLICLPTANEHENINEDISDYSSLLDVYRKKCMEVSENCGVLSEALTSPRRNVTRPRSGGEWKDRGEHRNTRSRRNSFHFERTSRNIRSETPSLTEHGGLKHTTSEISIADSGYSMASSDVSRKEESTVPRLHLQVEDSSDLGQMESDRTEDKTLLELVCDELPDVQQIQAFGDLSEKKHQTEKVDLEVIANPKEIQKPKVKRRAGPTQAAPFAPLCFTVNARPPDGYIYYFAYGADMNPSRISTYIQRKVENRFWGLLFGFNLVFNKKGSDLEAGAFANIEFNPFCSTEGCIYQITPQELELLDKFVGYPKHYEHLMLPVWMMNSKESDEFGVAQYCVPAVMYIAQQEWIAKDEEKLNCDYALMQCIKSSDLVTPDYREYLVNKGGPIEIKS